MSRRMSTRLVHAQGSSQNQSIFLLGKNKFRIFHFQIL